MRLRLAFLEHECDDDCRDNGCSGEGQALDKEFLKMQLRRLGKAAIRFIYGEDPFQELARRIDLSDRMAEASLMKFAKSIGAKCNQPLNAYPHLRCTEPFGTYHSHQHAHNGEITHDGATGAQGAQSS